MRVLILSVGLLHALLHTMPAEAVPISIDGADVRGQAIRLNEARGSVVAITFASRYTGDEAERVNKALSLEVNASVRMVSVVDFSGIPELFYGMARHIIATWAPRTTARLVVDERGLWRAALGAAPDVRVDIIVLDREGELRGHFVGAGQVEEARRLIHLLEAQPAAS
jgi:hypothetical protein